MPVPFVYRVAVRSTLKGTKKIVNTFALRDGQPGSDPATVVANYAAALAATGTGGIADAYKGMLLNTDKLDEIRVSQIASPSNPREPLIAASAFPNVAGTRVGVNPDLPDEMNVTVTLQTGFTGRRFRGRMYLPGPAGSAHINGEVILTTGGYYTALTAFISQLDKLRDASGSHLTGNLADADLTVFSAAQELSSPPGHHLVTNLRLNLKLHWMRSRAA